MATNVSISLRGGLGNQLFGIYAAIQLKKILRRNLAIQLSDVDYSHNTSRFDVKSLVIDQSLDFVQHRKNLEKISLKLYAKINRSRFSQLSKWTPISVINGDKLTLEQLAREIILSSRLKHFLAVEGYFQDFSHFFSVKDSLPAPKLKNPSKWFLNKQDEILNEKPIIVHIRMGDYLNNTIGTLTNNYFKKALDSLQTTLNSENILVCTDSPELASNYIGKWKDSKVSILEIGTDPAETLLLMSNHNGLICSNSTFSYWAGALSNTQKIVYAPTHFSKFGTHHIRNVPQEWTLIESDWN